MNNIPRIERRIERTRPCSCGRSHDLKIIHGQLFYGQENWSAFTLSFAEHHNQRHIWLGLITGAWPEHPASDCCITLHLWQEPSGIIMRIEDPTDSPLQTQEMYDSYPLSRADVLAQEGAKEWVISAYESLLKAEPEIKQFFSVAIAPAT